jgi:hypothetical protein
MQAKQVQTWLKTKASDAQVQLLAARAEAFEGNWEKAKAFAQKSEELAPSAAARIEIARAELAQVSESSAESEEPNEAA